MRLRGGQKAESSKERALFTALFVFVFVLCFMFYHIVVSLSRLLLLFASLAQEYYYYLLPTSLLGRADSTELKNSILSVKKNILNTHTYVRTTCVQDFSSGAFIIALDI